MEGQGFWSAQFQSPAAAGIGAVPQHSGNTFMVPLFILIVICTKNQLYYIFFAKIPI
jgi:hypothetical protein